MLTIILIITTIICAFLHMLVLTGIAREIEMLEECQCMLNDIRNNQEKLNIKDGE